MQQRAQPSTGHAGGMTPESKWGGIDRLIAGIPHEALAQVEGLAAFPGIVLERTVRQAAGDWNAGIGKHFLVAGYHQLEVSKRLFARESLGDNFSLNRRNNLHTQVDAVHAGEQTAWLAQQVKKHRIGSLGIYVSNFHLPRIFMTMVESMRRLDVQTVIIPVPTRMSPFERVLLDVREKSYDKRDLNQTDVLYQEFDPRLKAYQMPKTDGSPGDAATDETFLDYMRWLYDQPIITNVLLTEGN